MNCGKCGANLEPNDSFCPICGAPVPTQNQYQNNNGGMQNGNVGFSYERPVSEQMYNNVQQPNVQQDMGQNYGQPAGNLGGQKPNGKNSNNNMKMIVICIIVIAVIITLGVLGYTMISASKKDKEEGNVEKKSSQNVENNNRETNKNNNSNNDYNYDYPNTNNNYDDDYLFNTNENNNSNYNDPFSNNTGNNTTTPNQNTTKPDSTYTAELGGFELYVPDKLLYQVDTATNNLSITNQEDSWVVSIQIIEGSYQNIKQKKATLKSAFLQQQSSLSNPEVSDAKVETINGVEYILLEVSADGENGIVAYTQLNSKYSAAIVAMSEEDFDRTPLKEVAPIFSTANFTGKTSNIKANTEINMDEVQKIYKNLAE